ncbi:MAG: hemolysin family protein [Brevibacterium sp.]|uniref:hemolysin family protein n=1 Tax=Brevibacterium sp. TaxID=1701 RepID=UPI002649BA40|nr:hemolysin family protein [Brevibacterium sp.]MDN5805677.1 hemolysin family protein [Brevibacterium sp.]MDN5875884.1 hemolysin family protein [Brevibacterium sp.]MDN5908750.1 hemolysin family protein [Brevibacterium sp.]MDN6123780.1 hemolysin family protein [Brevibacterium sp.]MDN6134247.1 hemolysin family protein [Brevibacterium sp.]
MEWLYLALALILICGTGVFVAAEFSLLTLDRHTADKAVEQGVVGAKTLRRSMTHLSTQLSAAQVGITITTLLTGYLMEPSLGKLLAPVFESIGASPGIAAPIALTIALIVSTFLSMIFGELVPKNLAIAVPLATGRIAAPVQYVFSIAFKPVISVLNGTANKILLSVGIEPQEEGSVGRSPEELTSLVRHSAEEGMLDEQTADLLERTLSFSERTAEDVMTPRTRMSSVVKDTTARQIIEQARDTGFSRFPVAGEDKDHIVGVVHVKQAFAVPLANRDDAYAGGLMTEVTEIPETLLLDPLLMELRAKGLQMAVVVDEFGGTAGVVTLEDVVEELVGEVADEHDRMRVAARPARDGTWIVPGQLRPDEVSSTIGLEIPEDSDYETLAGFVLKEMGRIPDPGDQIRTEDALIRVERMHGRRIERLRILLRATDAVGYEQGGDF